MSKKEILNNDALTVRVGEGAVDAVEGALDVLEGKIETLENITGNAVTVTKNNPWLIVGALVVGVGVGGFIAYKIAKKRTTAYYEEELREQVAAARSFQKRLAKTDEFESPESAAQALIPDSVVDVVKTYRGDAPEEKVAYNKIPPSKAAEDVVQAPETPPVEETTSTAVDRNVFENPKDNPRDWDYQAEIAAREEKPDSPYVISFDEYIENPEDHEQVTVTYYEKDDTLVDERTQPIDDVEKTVGDDNLERFGHGSNDINVVYVRNERLSMDFEIIRDPGSYHHEVLGLDDQERTIQHSRQRRGRKHRADE